MLSESLRTGVTLADKISAAAAEAVLRLFPFASTVILFEKVSEVASEESSAF